jgi:hypothetical protein
MSGIDHYRLLHVQEELEDLERLANAMPGHPEAHHVRLLLHCARHAIMQVQKIVDVAEPLVEPMPWWQDWQVRKD